MTAGAEEPHADIATPEDAITSLAAQAKRRCRVLARGGCTPFPSSANSRASGILRSIPRNSGDASRWRRPDEPARKRLARAGDHCIIVRGASTNRVGERTSNGVYKSNAPPTSRTGPACRWYKGRAEWWSVRAGDSVHQDLAWSYAMPLPESQKVGGLVSF